MARVRRAAAWLLGVVLGLVVLVTAALFVLTQTGIGVSWVRSFAIDMAQDAVHGRLYLGRLDLGFGCAVSVDSVEIRDPSDSLMLATGPVRARCDLASLLLRRRLVLRSADVTRPVMILREDSASVWNVSRVFPPDTTILQDTIRGPGVILNDVRIVGGSFLLEMPWSPDESLTGAARDSTVAAALAMEGSEIVPGAGSFVRRWRWTGVNLSAPRIELATVASDMELDIAALSLLESDPPLTLRDARGTVRLADDTVTIDLPAFALTASRGALAGTLALDGNEGNLGYNLRLRGDTVALADVAWITDLLPREGGGRADVHIVNGDDPSVVEYRVTDMDVVSTDSHLLGGITFGVGGPLLQITDVALDLQPMDMDLVRILTGGPLPYDFQGTITGRLDASGGPLNRFIVDSARVRYDDRTVTGAVSMIQARGGLDMSRPGATAFRAFTLDVQPFDVRSWTRQDSMLPPLSGTLTGRVTLDSVYSDIRLRNLDAFYREGPAPPLHALGGGRIIFLDEGLRYNLDLQFEPLSFGALATAYPAVDSLSPASGALHIEGITSDLAIVGTLAGPGGTVNVDGRFDVEQPQWRGVGTVRASELDLAEASTRNGLPHTRLDLVAEADIAGDSLANLVGHLNVDVDSSSAQGVDIVSATSRLVFADGRARVDSLEAFTSVGDLRATGALSLTRDRFDSLFVVALSDSVSRVLALLGAITDSTAIPDSTEVGGSLGITAVLTGSVDSLDLNGTARAQSLRAFGTYEAYAQADIALQGLPSEPHGTLEVVVDSGTIGGVLLQSVLASATFGGLDDIQYSLRAETGDTIQLRASGSAMLGDSTRRVVTLDSLYFASYRLPRSALTLAAPTQI
ncbi:MAG TPA: hypothetical protein VFG84_12445, partial [Gemmatimonadaceae bacterium]|nr:hypothetical protein [Gemmatimonadaceae bacterium]